MSTITPISECALAFAAAVLIVTGADARAAVDLPPELRPYDVELAIGFARGAEFSAAFRQRVRDDVRNLFVRTTGERWKLSVAEARPGDELAPAMDGASQAGTSADSLPKKRLLVMVESRGAGYAATAREWDATTSTFGPARTAIATTRPEIATSIATAVNDAFRQLAMIESRDDGTSVLTLQAGAIPTPDPDAAAVGKGSIFVPYLRKFDRDGQLLETRAVPYTVLTVGDVHDGVAAAEVHSALRSPLGGRRGTLEAWCIAASAAWDSTRLTIVRREDGVPLAGRIVEIRNEPFQPGKEEPKPAETLLTDRSGSVTLAVAPDRSVAWITVKSGDATLMRLPVAPGLERSVTLPLGDDQRRLGAEGRLSILTGELIETVAKRATLLASARNNARAGRYVEADDAVVQAEKLPTAEAFRRRIAAVEAPAAKAAEDDGDRLSAARIRALGRKASSLVDRYLNPDPLRATREEVEELKRTDPNRK